ncbi:hypothetical protein F3P66_15625 [Agrobacterium fabrum]|uniref:Uncharacterized protein n=1 Tax=Agrobacterium fabrum (strain C58 / ATCC 33970) TaxID=176299 RepID=A9CEV7_AGRFC|nr:hypothetical protein Atu3221 [Agrobacterium fabrum str. C58]QRM60911.1 hypothetical protein F3P66_15625 [Agrobacterium fabrum]TRB29819.1 hypothetical protein EXN51_08450 [Agrobacterium fabrum]
MTQNSDKNHLLICITIRHCHILSSDIALDKAGMPAVRTRKREYLILLIYINLFQNFMILASF